MLFRIGLMNQARLDVLRRVLFADALGLLDEILDFDEKSRDEHVAPLQPTRPDPSSYGARAASCTSQFSLLRTGRPGPNDAARASSLRVAILQVPRIDPLPPFKDTLSRRLTWLNSYLVHFERWLA